MKEHNSLDEIIPSSIKPHLNEIAERLWAGRAAIMIGAGFSKNANPSLPDWTQLGDLLYLKAYGTEPTIEDQKYQNVLRLAEEVEANIGRPALDNLLISSIPDLSAEPSKLHVQLLELPWADVFTTNYDTFLERASAKILTRRYEPVNNKDDLSYATKPRIIKLHGSFPSQKPFIITEEDYRLYPNNNAPFVNTVQQSLLENTFCLIGFSGDDPNFLQWIGWIRDKLGDSNTQKIYLVGIFNLSPAKLQLMLKRGVIVVDLSCCTGLDKSSHQQAIELFLKYMNSKNMDILEWPDNYQMMQPSQSTEKLEQTKSIIEVWKRQRQRYPGWLILPSSNLTNLFVYTKYWINYFPDNDDSFHEIDILYCFELIWRLEKCLLPITSDIAYLSENLLNKYWPFSIENKKLNNDSITYSKNKNNLSWTEILEAWLAIAFSLLRFYREEGFLDKWEKMYEQLLSLNNYINTDQKEKLEYERILFCLFTLNLKEAKHNLEQWTPNKSQPYWVVKRAAVLAELGQANEVLELAAGALNSIRKIMYHKPNTLDISLVSQESYAMLLTKYINDATTFPGGDVNELDIDKKQFNDRWNEMKGYKCDPWNELKLFDLTLNIHYKPPKDVSEKHEFDIGQVSQSLHINSENSETIVAYSFLRFSEEIGLPYQIGNVTLGKKIAEKSLNRISKFSPFWSTAILARLGDKNAIESVYGRESLTRISSTDADQLILNYLDALKECQESIEVTDLFKNKNFANRLASLLPEFISRLCCKCSTEVKPQIYDLIIKLYSSNNKNEYSNIGHLVQRFIKSLSKSETYELIPKLIEVPYPRQVSQVNEREFINPLVLIDLNKKNDSVNKQISIDDKLVEKLKKQAVSEDKLERSWAIASIVKLINFKILSDEQCNKFSDTLWLKQDKYGFPKDTPFHKFVFLNLPSPEGVNTKTLFKEYINNISTINHDSERTVGVNITGGDIPLIIEIIGANYFDKNFWTTDETDVFLKSLFKWWGNEKELFTNILKAHQMVQGELELKFRHIINLFNIVIAPRLNKETSNELKINLLNLLTEMKDSNLFVVSAEASCIHLFPSLKQNIINRIKESLNSNHHLEISDGLKAITILLEKNKSTSSLAAKAIEALSYFILWCPIPSLGSTLITTKRIIEDKFFPVVGEFEHAVLTCLSSIIFLTDYENDNINIIFEEQLNIRLNATTLAVILWNGSVKNLSHIFSRQSQACI